MTEFNLTINCDNDAFDERDGEVSRILALLAALLEIGDAGQGGKLRDINGNTVGSFYFDDTNREITNF